jgi:hypothetical protein
LRDDAGGDVYVPDTDIGTVQGDGKQVGRRDRTRAGVSDAVMYLIRHSSIPSTCFPSQSPMKIET